MFSPNKAKKKPTGSKKKTTPNENMHKHAQPLATQALIA